MKTIGGALQTHLNGEVTTLAMCWKLIRPDAQVFGFTTHHADLIVSGVTYKSLGAFVPTAVETQAGVNVDNMEVSGALGQLGISSQDILDGRIDGSTVELFMVNYVVPTDGIIKLRSGRLGEEKFGRQSFGVEIRGLLHNLSKEFGEIYTPGCRADLGDERCTVNLAPFTVTGAITSATSGRVFRDTSRTEADGYFVYGLFTWTSGENNGLAMEVKKWTLSTKEFEIFQSMPEPINVGDTYSVYHGCDKKLATCRDVFDNVVNFRGEPHVPAKAAASVASIAQGGSVKSSIK